MSAMTKKDTNQRLVLLVLVMMIVGIATSLYTLWYSIQNRNAFEKELRNSLMTELAKYNFPQDAEVTVDDAKLYLAVAKYCESRNNCVGPHGADGRDGNDGENGLDGSDGADGAVGLTGLPGQDGEDGYTPVKGVDYNDGEQGPAGEPARNVERRCNPERNRIEWRLEGDTNWQVEFNLAPGQTCEVEVEE